MFTHSIWNTCYCHRGRQIVQCSENKGANQLCRYSENDLRLCYAYSKSRFSHDAAHMWITYRIGHMASEERSFENVTGTDWTDANI